MQTLKQAVHLATSGTSRALCSAAFALHGKPVGGWPETEQARREIGDALPHRTDREYTVTDFVAALYTVDHADRYRSNIWLEEQRREEAQAVARQAEREAEIREAFAACPALSLGNTRVELDTDGYIVQWGPELTSELLAAALPTDWLASAKRVRELVRRAA